MDIYHMKTKWILISVAMMAIITLGAFQKAQAYRQTEPRFYLVSIGVGDEDLITVRAINTLKSSDSMPDTRIRSISSEVV
jgi:hypothetical protein